jgi:formylglycine-generating enzyme required for sulfatase activity
VRGVSDANLEQFPVEKVSWEDVQQFLRRLNAREGESGIRYRLPSGLEWEYACRGGATSREECAFDFYLAQPANDLSSEQANFDGNHPAGKAPAGQYRERTTKVGSYTPNRLGLYDMHGNVWEWCEDRFEAGGSARVFRGGSWINDDSVCRASCRSRLELTYRTSDLGFRLAAVPFGE